MVDDICVNIYDGIGRTFGSMANRIFAPGSAEAQQSNWQTLFAGLLVLIAIVMALMQVQQRKEININEKRRNSADVDRREDL